MKSFSASSFATDNAAALDLALDAVRNDPHALFTDFQWFLFEVQNTVWYTAFSTRRMDRDALGNIVAEMVALAPQLTHGFVGATPGHPFAKHLIDAITSVVEVDDFDGYPDKALASGLEIFEATDLPLFRVKAYVRRGGPDAQGRESLILIRAAHALMEGSDSALLTRSQSANHGIMRDTKNQLPLKDRIGSRLTAWISTAIHLFLGNVFAKDKPDLAFGSLAIERRRLRRLAARLGVRQRSLFFALVTHALNGDGPDRDLAKHVIGAAYTMLDSKRNASDDDFFRVRALQTKFKVEDDFLAYVRKVDETMSALEQKDITKFQQIINSTFTMHRWLHKVAPWVHSRKFWKYSAGIDIVLTLVPPHRLFGNLTEGMMEPVYCGSFHPGQNLVTFCPGKEYITLNCSMSQRHVLNLPRIEKLLAEVEAMDLPVPQKVGSPAA